MYNIYYSSSLTLVSRKIGILYHPHKLEFYKIMLPHYWYFGLINSAWTSANLYYTYIVIKACLEFRSNDSSKSPFLLLNTNASDGKMHLRAIDYCLREEIHKKVLGLDLKRDCRSAHDCRRTYASLEYLNGTDIYTLMK